MYSAVLYCTTEKMVCAFVHYWYGVKLSCNLEYSAEIPRKQVISSEVRH